MKIAILKLLAFVTIFLIAACSNEGDPPEDIAKIDLINDSFPEYQKEIELTLEDLFRSIDEGDADKLISFHVYGPKFTEFKEGGLRVGSAENEAYERGLVGAISGFGYDLGDLKIDVFGEVAKVTFHATFSPVIDGVTYENKAQITLLFVRVEGKWKITHEHNSPLMPATDAKLTAL